MIRYSPLGWHQKWKFIAILRSWMNGSGMAFLLLCILHLYITPSQALLLSQSRPPRDLQKKAHNFQNGIGNIVDVIACKIIQCLLYGTYVLCGYHVCNCNFIIGVQTHPIIAFLPSHVLSLLFCMPAINHSMSICLFYSLTHRSILYRCLTQFHYSLLMMLLLLFLSLLRVMISRYCVCVCMCLYERKERNWLINEYDNMSLRIYKHHQDLM